MTKWTLLAALCGLALTRTGGTADAFGAAMPRITTTINREWTFNYFPEQEPDSAPAAPDYDDSRWPAVALPHTWSTYETTGDVHPFIYSPSENDDPYWWNGWGWYRKRFTLGPQASGKKVCIEFDGVMKYCQVYCNGHYLGDHKGGYTSFEFDLTPYVNAPGENLIAVCVSNRRVDPYRIPPMNAGNMDVYGGIYRDARIVVKDLVYIPFQGSFRHEGGVFITTPEVSEASARVRVRTWVQNDCPAPKPVAVHTMVLDASGMAVTELRTARSLPAGALTEFDQTSDWIPRPRLWSPESPYLYRVVSEVEYDTRVVDRIENPLGFRWFRWDYDRNRLYLNGQPVHIHGTNRVQDYPWLGDAVPKWLLEADMVDIRNDLAHNFIRPSVSPADPLFYDLCDRLGIMVCDVVPNIKDIDFSEEVQREQLVQVIRRDRNHPSVMFWSLGNETNDAADSAWARAEDDTRIINQRHVTNDSAGAYAPHSDRNMDLEHLLRCTVRGWTDSDVRDLEPVNCQHAGNEEWQHRMARVWDGSHRGRIDMATGVMWMYADSGADREYLNCPLKHLNPKGWVDLYRIPKYMYYLWQANYLDRPMLFIHPHYWQQRYAGQKKAIVVDSNCEAVELFSNGRSCGVLRPTAENFHTVTFQNVPIGPGTLEARGTWKGRDVRSQVEMAGQPARLVLTSTHRRFPAARDSLAVLTVDVVDAGGARVQGATPPLTWSVDGPGRLVATATYESEIYAGGRMGGTFYITTPVRNLVRSIGQPGTITVTVNSAGLAPGRVEIAAEALPGDASRMVGEPRLAWQGRRPVVRTEALPGRWDEAAAHLPLLQQDLQYPPNLQASEYAARLRELLGARYSQLGPWSVESEAMVRHLSRHLAANRGLLVADDFNFSLARLSDCLRITRALFERPLPPGFRFSQRKYYARQILEQGTPVDVDAAVARLHAIPEGSVEVLANTGDLDQLIGQVYEDYPRLDTDQREDLCRCVVALNTYVDPQTHDEAVNRYIILPPLALKAAAR